MDPQEPEHPNESSIFGDSEPPNDQPQVIAASDHQTHPFWDGRGRGGRSGRSARGARRGGAKGGGGGSSGVQRQQEQQQQHHSSGNGAPNSVPAAPPITTLIVDPEEDRPAFTGISLRELEFVKRRNADGAESTIASESEYYRRNERKRKRRSSQRTGGSQDERRGVAAAAQGGNDEDDANLMAAAAFGQNRPANPPPKKPTSNKKGVDEEEEDNDDGEEEEDGDGEEGYSEYDDDDDAGASEAQDSSAFGQNNSFPIRGESCIGCVFDRDVVGKVDDFVRRHCGSMTETALFRAASQYWYSEVVCPRASESVQVPRWHWKDLRSHYELHSVDPVMQRTAAVRTLGAMRSYHEQSLLRVNPDGTKQLDPKAADLMLKLVALSDKQISALDAARMPPPPSQASGSGRRK